MAVVSIHPFAKYLFHHKWNIIMKEDCVYVYQFHRKNFQSEIYTICNDDGGGGSGSFEKCEYLLLLFDIRYKQAFYCSFANGLMGNATFAI